MTITTTLTPFPNPAPNIQSQSQEEFSANADSAFTHLMHEFPEFNNFASEANALADQVNADAITATTQAGIATTKAGEAATSAANALASEQNASTSEANALASEQAALASLNDFKSTYYGERVSDPTLDPAGNPVTEGDLYFNSVTKELRFYDGNNWVPLSPSTIPPGVIVMWSGSIATIPSGWALCNGANGTPDLRDRFVVGAGSTYAVGAKGGNKDAIVPAHTHTASTNSTGAHTHSVSGTAASAGAHAHGIGYYPVTGSGTMRPIISSSNQYTNAQQQATSSAGAHTHSVSGTAASAGAHSHTVTVNSTGVSAKNANLPPYYALAYIMKL